jgi:hypothetical protein
MSKKTEIKPAAPKETIERFTLALRVVDWTIVRALASGKYPRGETGRKTDATEHATKALVSCS